MKLLPRIAKYCWNAYAAVFARTAGGAMGNRGLALALLLASIILIIGPWMRSSVSRDFRGVHIPWTNSSTARFLPEFVAEAPREWRMDSIAVPLLAVVGVGILVVLLRRRWTSHVFGLLAAVTIPALAVSLWNHPGLYEFFESEIRGRSILRTVYTHSSSDLMTVRAPDRLQAFGGQKEKVDLLEPTHSVMAPFQYWMYGPWLLTAALVGAIATRRDTWLRRFAYAGMWAACGIMLAGAATWPRWLAEYHWARADRLESVNQFAEATDALDDARRAMPDLGATRRYWVARGRLDYRQRKSGKYSGYFSAYQYLNSGDADRAQAELQPYVRGSGGSTAQRDLLSEILAHIGSSHVANGKRAAAELAFAEATAVAPWKPTCWVAQAVTELDSAPQRAKEIEDRLLDKLVEVGDCFVSSDFASALGDAYFETGDFKRARDMYAKAMQLFHLPKYVNLHAQEGRLGM